MSNKGTQALLESDISIIGKVTQGKITISTTDIEGVSKLNLNVEAVLPPIVDLPYERVDQLAKMKQFGRNSVRYKILSSVMLVNMFFQLFFSILSISLVKLGSGAPYRREVFEKLRNCDLVISHSDESYKESATLLPLNPLWALTWWSLLVARTWEVMVAKSLGKPVVLFPNSVGPFRTWVGRSLARLSFNSFDYILIRDRISYSILEQLGTKSRKILTFDTALLFEAPRTQALDDLPRPLLGVSPGVYSNSISSEEFDKYVASHASALDFAIERFGFHVVFLPHYISGFEFDDLEVCKRILALMKNRDRIRIFATDAAEEYKSYLDQMDMIVSSKMHPAVLGATGYVPIVCIAYDHKQTGFFERLNMTDCVLDIRSTSAERLTHKIEEVWSLRRQLRESLKKQIPLWQEHVREVISRTLLRYTR
jgi:polysaccharide pyruvyl transferase WcaK-like protein